jgi:hypothetical protein
MSLPAVAFNGPCCAPATQKLAAVPGGTMADPIDMIRQAEEPIVQVERLPFRSTVAAYQSQAEELFRAWKADDPDGIEFFRTKHPQFRDDKIRWLAKQVQPDEIRNTAFDYADAQLAIARWYDFRDWPALAEWVEAVAQKCSAVEKFESAVEAIIHGDTAVLQRLLGDWPHLVHSRSTRIASFDPPMHRATLLHYIGANGVEGYREMTPSNAVSRCKQVPRSTALLI